jgi:hypothetical protein
LVEHVNELVDQDGLPQFGPMANFVNARLAQAFEKYMDDLKADPNGFPDGRAHVKHMREVKLAAIAEWNRLINPNPNPNP